jgi:hypothetical protein
VRDGNSDNASRQRQENHLPQHAAKAAEKIGISEKSENAKRMGQVVGVGDAEEVNQIPKKQYDDYGEKDRGPIEAPLPHDPLPLVAAAARLFHPERRRHDFDIY